MQQSSYADVASSFAQSLKRAMSVAGESEDEQTKRITQHELADRSNVARSTIAKYWAPGDNKINPDLSTICSLADALNVPPAFLLLRPEDWSHIAQASAYFATAISDSNFRDFANKLMQLPRVSSEEMSDSGLHLAGLFGLLTSFSKTKNEGLDARVKKKNANVKRGVVTMSALPPTSAISKESLAPLLSLCAILGAHQ